MEEVEISDAIYGDLGDFEISEKVKEQNQEISDLTVRLNQSIATVEELQQEIKHLKKENKKLLKNLSSYHETAKLEMKRKEQEITSLQQKNDNRIFRRKNNVSIAVQTDQDITIDPLFHHNANSNNENILEQMQHHQQIVDKYTQSNSETVNKWKGARSDFNKFRIPKKNRLARHDNNESKNGIIVNNEKKIGDSQPRHHLPKNNPHAANANANLAHVSSSDRNELIEERKSRCKSRIDADRDKRGHCPVAYTSSRHRDTNKYNPDDQKWQRERNGRKRSYGRSSSGEPDRHSKRRRSVSTSNRHRSKSSRNEEKQSKAKSPKRNKLKPGKDKQIDDVTVMDDSFSNLKEKDLEAMLISQQKVLDEINSKGEEQHPVLKAKSSKEHRKRKYSNTVDPVDKLANSDISEASGLVCSGTEASIIRETEAVTISECKKTDEVVLADTEASQKKLNKSNVSPGNLEVVSVAISNSTEELLPIKGTETESLAKIDSKPFTPLRESEPSEPTVIKHDVLETIEGQCNEDTKSPIPMDIDYELMEQTSNQNQNNLSCEEKNRELVMDNTLKTMPSDVNNDNICESLSQQISASFIAIENNVSDGCVDENHLNSSHERHVLSKSSEYTVQDVGHEIRIFLKKKRKKNKNDKILTIR